MNQKKQAQLRRSRKIRYKIRQSGMPRLTVHRTSMHIYAQVIDVNATVVASVSTVQKTIRQAVNYTGNITAATVVGKAIAEAAKAAGVEKVAFDRSGYKYHGRVKALADSARENGLQF